MGLMNETIKALWVKALRSGDYRQTQRVLRNHDNGFCCLGVLCDIAARHNDVAEEEGWRGTEDCWSFDGSESVLPKSVVEWAGLESQDPLVRETDTTLTELNDNGRNTFAEIADLIEENL